MIGPAFRTVLGCASVLLLLFQGVARAHVPDDPGAARAHIAHKIVIDLEVREESWVATSEMDVKFAVVALMRHRVPEDIGSGWVENLNPGQVGLVREVTEKFFRERFCLTMNGDPVAMEVHFPDYERSPLTFRAAANGEPMTRVVMTGRSPSSGEPMTVGWQGRWGPTLVLSVKQAGRGEKPEIHTLDLGESLTLGDPELPRGGDREPPGLMGWVGSGLAHLVPMGPVHVLFIFGFVLLGSRRDALLLQGLCFTVAHSVTLWLVGLGVVTIPDGVIEPLLALSIVYIGIENLFLREPTPWRLGMVSGFGLLHGIGFALVVREIAQAQTPLLSPLVGFHLGVELGQAIVIGVAMLVAWPFMAKTSFAKVRVLGSAGIASVGLFWTIELMMT